MLIRPADANEVVEAWKVIMQLDHEPAALVLSRQPVPTFDRSKYGAASESGQGSLHPGRRLRRQTGSHSDVDRERSISVRERLTSSSKPKALKRAWSACRRGIFLSSQSDEYKAKVLPPEVKARVAVEQAAVFGWSTVRGPKRHGNRNATDSELQLRSRICRRSSGSPPKT